VGLKFVQRAELIVWGKQILDNSKEKNNPKHD